MYEDQKIIEGSGVDARELDTTLESEKGGQPTISPPAKVKCAGVLLSGFDYLTLAINLQWEKSDFLECLGELKAKAKEHSEDQAHSVGDWSFSVKPHGVKGYEWLLVGKEFKEVKVGNWLNPTSRPSLMVNIGSETLWAQGPVIAVERIVSIFKELGAQVLEIKPSRADLCVDMLLDDSVWTTELVKNSVTRAVKSTTHFENNIMTGITIGPGSPVSARLYDKFREIVTNKKKTWFFDLWQLNTEPEGFKIIRVEFQLRRPVLKELGMESITDLFSVSDNAWSYCAEKWLKFQDRPGNHHTMRKTFPWWEVVQNGFYGSQNPNPLIRCKSIRQDKEQIFAQAYGLLSSLAAICQEESEEEITAPTNLIKSLQEIIKTCDEKGWKLDHFAQKVINKRAKYHRSLVKAIISLENRMQNNFPSGNLTWLQEQLSDVPF